MPVLVLGGLQVADGRQLFVRQGDVEVREVVLVVGLF